MPSSAGESDSRRMTLPRLRNKHLAGSFARGTIYLRYLLDLSLPRPTPSPMRPGARLPWARAEPCYPKRVEKWRSLKNCACVLNSPPATLGHVRRVRSEVAHLRAQKARYQGLTKTGALRRRRVELRRLHRNAARSPEHPNKNSSKVRPRRCRSRLRRPADSSAGRLAARR